MATTATNWHEPRQFTQGDTLSFTRKLDGYSSVDGWSLTYALRLSIGPAIEFSSTSNGSEHVILVPAATTTAWVPGDYTLEGWAVNADGTRTQIYLGSLTITPDVGADAGDVDTTTHAQRMIKLLEGQLEALAAHVLDATDVEGTRIQREKRLALLNERNRYIQERRGEVAAENARNGKPNPRKIHTQFAICAPGAVGVRNLGAGDSVFNTQFP